MSMPASAEKTSILNIKSPLQLCIHLQNCTLCFPDQPPRLAVHRAVPLLEQEAFLLGGHSVTLPSSGILLPLQQHKGLPEGDGESDGQVTRDVGKISIKHTHTKSVFLKTFGLTSPCGFEALSECSSWSFSALKS